MTQRKAVLVMGAGDATGGAIARRFAREGYVACVARRNAEKLEPLVQAIRDQGGEALACGCDARQEQQVIDLFARIGEVGALEAVIFNVGANVWFPITETTERVYRKVWGDGRLRRLPHRPRGGAGDAAAAARNDHLHWRHRLVARPRAFRRVLRRQVRPACPGPKHGARAGPKGIHVAHPIIDGAIDTDFIRETLPELYKRKEQDGILDPEHIAETYWQIHCQPRDCWVHELDLRPWMETF